MKELSQSPFFEQNDDIKTITESVKDALDTINNAMLEMYNNDVTHEAFFYWNAVLYEFGYQVNKRGELYSYHEGG